MKATGFHDYIIDLSKQPLAILKHHERRIKRVAGSPGGRGVLVVWLYLIHKLSLIVVVFPNIAHNFVRLEE
jgi:hypothetical protein